MKWIGLLGLMLAFLLPAGAAPAHVDFERKWIFPQDLGGLKYVISEKFEETDFGYRIIYRAGESFEAEINVYDLGQESIPSGYKEQIPEIEKVEEWAKHPDRRALFDQLLIVE